MLRGLSLRDLHREGPGEHRREDGQDPSRCHRLHGEAIGRCCEEVGVLADGEQESARHVDPEAYAQGGDEPGPAGGYGVGLDAVEDVDETEEEGRHEERFCRMRESAAEGSAVHYKACGDHCCEGDEEDEVVDEDYFADCFEACELVWLSVQEGGDSACGHCAGEPCEGEALSMSVCG